MSDNVKYIEAILPRPLKGTFTYELPPELIDRALPGKRAVVGFGKKKLYTAIIYSIHNSKPDDFDPKPVIEIIDNEPIVNDFQLKLWDWIADYYMCTIGEVYNASIPSSLKLQSESRILYNPDFDRDFPLNPEQSNFLDILEKKGVMSIDDVNRVLQLQHPLSFLNPLFENNIIRHEEQIKDFYKPKTVPYIRLSKEYEDELVLSKTLDSLKNAKKQQLVLMSYLSLVNLYDKDSNKEVRKDVLVVHSKATGGIIKALVVKGIFEEINREVGRIPVNLSGNKKLKELNASQDKALLEIKTLFNSKSVVLLNGVTSSGKTEIYIHLIQEAINTGKQVLYMLPEIALTTQIITRLSSVFGNDVGVYHSRVSNSERVEVWNRVRYTNKSDSYKIILGARSSVFLPFSNLGLIIVDEEHENSFKQFSPAPRYNARDISIVLGNIHKAKVLLGSATPSIESYYNSLSGKYGKVDLKTRYLDIQMPEIEIADILRSRKRKLMRSIFTPELIDGISTSLQNNEQVILFQNRRGFSPYTECSSCGWVPKCDNCDVSLIYHKRTNDMNCHYCGFSHRLYHKCEDCGNEILDMKGFGTERVEQEIMEIFPEAKVSRLDFDSTRRKNSYEKLISDFELGKVDILVGTQMVSKGLDFDNVSIVGVLNADSMMNFPDFRAFERSYQLMTQVSGRAGRKKKRGKVVIQTVDPEHPIIESVKDGNYEEMFRSQMMDRQDFNYPPYYRLIKITIKHKVKFILDNATEELGRKLKAIFGARMLGPESPAVNRIQNRYLMNILLKIEKNKSAAKARELIHSSCDEVLASPDYRSLSIIFDVDPM